MREKIARILKLTRRVVASMDRFLQAAKGVEVMLGTRSDFHCLISLHDNSVVPRRQAIAPIHSKLILRAIDRTNIAAESAIHALSDAFAVCKRVLDIQKTGHPLGNSLPITPFPSRLTLPRWLSKSSNGMPLADPSRIEHICVDDSMYSTLDKLPLPALVRTYGEFFRFLWERDKSDLNWKGKMMYEKLYPPWIRQNVVFLRGADNSISIPCRYGSLPRKCILKDKDQKSVGAAILCTWLEREQETADALKYFLEKNGVQF